MDKSPKNWFSIIIWKLYLVVLTNMNNLIFRTAFKSNMKIPMSSQVGLLRSNIVAQITWVLDPLVDGVFVDFQGPYRGCCVGTFVTVVAHTLVLESRMERMVIYKQ